MDARGDCKNSPITLDWSNPLNNDNYDEELALDNKKNRTGCVDCSCFWTSVIMLCLSLSSVSIGVATIGCTWVDRMQPNGELGVICGTAKANWTVFDSCVKCDKPKMPKPVVLSYRQTGQVVDRQAEMQQTQQNGKPLFTLAYLRHIGISCHLVTYAVILILHGALFEGLCHSRYRYRKTAIKTNAMFCIFTLLIGCGVSNVCGEKIYVNQAKMNYAITSNFRVCSSANNKIKTDLGSWTYLGNDSSLSEWNKKVCEMPAEKLIEMYSKLVFNYRACTSLSSHDSCLNEIEKLKKIETTHKCECNYVHFRRLETYMKSRRYESAMSAMTYYLESCKKCDNLKIAIYGKDKLHNYRVMIFETSDDIMKLREWIETIKRSGIQTETVIPNGEVWSPVLPYVCRGNVVMTNKTIKTPKLQPNECPLNTGIMKCSTNCYTITQSVRKYDKSMIHGSCCEDHSPHVDLKEIGKYCNKQTDNFIILNKDSCGSKKMYLFPCVACPTPSLLLKVGPAISSMTLDKVTRTMVVADCDFYDFLGDKVTLDEVDAKYKQYSKCNCEYGQLCMLRNGKTVELSQSGQFFSDREDGLIEVQVLSSRHDQISLSSRAMAVNGDYTLTNYGFSDSSEFLNGDLVMTNKIVKNDPWTISHNGPDLKITKTINNKPQTSKLNLEERDDIINTSEGQYTMDKCLANMESNTEKDYEELKECDFYGTAEKKKMYRRFEVWLIFFTASLVLMHLIVSVVANRDTSDLKAMAGYHLWLLRWSLWDNGELHERAYNRFYSPEDPPMKMSASDILTKSFKGEKLDRAPTYEEQMLSLRSSIMTAQNVLWRNSKLVYIVIKLTYHLPISLIITVPVSLLIGTVFSLILAVRSLIFGYTICDIESFDNGTQQLKHIGTCLLCATSLNDILSKPQFLFTVHCGPKVKKPRIFDLRRTIWIIVCVALVVVCYLYIYDVISLAIWAYGGDHTGKASIPLFAIGLVYKRQWALLLLMLSQARAQSIGHVLKLSSDCTSFLCTNKIVIGTNIIMTKGNYIDYPLEQDGEVIGKLRIEHNGLTLRHVGTYQHTTANFRKINKKMACLHSDTKVSDPRNCWDFYANSDLGKDYKCDYGANIAFDGEEDHFLNLPTYCNHWVPRGYALYTSLAIDGFENMAFSFEMQDDMVFRQYELSEARYEGNIKVIITINNVEEFNEEVEMDGIRDTYNFEKYNMQISVNQAASETRALGGEKIVCAFENLSSATPISCRLLDHKWRDGHQLRTYGERCDLSSGVLDYVEWDFTRDHLGSVDGLSRPVNTIKHKISLNDLMRDGSSISTATSCNIKVQTKTKHIDVSEERCSFRAYTTKGECQDSGGKWGMVRTCMPNPIEMTLVDCTVKSLRIKLSADLNLGVLPGKTNIIDPADCTFNQHGCYGVPNMLKLSVQCDEPQGVLKFQNGHGVICSTINFVDNSKAVFNCSLNFVESAEFTFENLNKVGHKIRISKEIKKCASYSHQVSELGVSNTARDVSKWSTWQWLIVSFIAFLTIMVVIPVVAIIAKVLAILFKTKQTVKITGELPEPPPILNGHQRHVSLDEMDLMRRRLKEKRQKK